MALQLRAGSSSVVVPDEFVERFATLLGVDPYRSRRSLDRRELPAMRDGVRDERRAVHARHVASVGGDDAEWKREWLKGVEDGDPWLRLLDEAWDLFARDEEIEVLGD